MKPPVITESTCIRFPMDYLRKSGIIERMYYNTRGKEIIKKYLMNPPPLLTNSSSYFVELNIRPGILHHQKGGYLLSTISIPTDLSYQYEEEWYINEEQYIKSFSDLDLPIETFLPTALKDVEVAMEFTINDIAEMHNLLTNL